MITEFELFERTKFNVGDYIVYDHDIYNDLNGEVVIRTNYPYQIINIDRAGNISYICDDGYETKTSVKDVKKISKKKAELLIAADKYNL